MSIAPNPSISVIIPTFNERETLRELHAQVVEQLRLLGGPYEILFIDDGSTDGSGEEARKLCAEDPCTCLIALAVNSGKAAALDIGFHAARGDVIVTMDADLQDDPVEIPNFIAKIREGYDLVTGWKAIRHDPWHKTMPSKAFNFVVARVSGLKLHDFNCGFKAYRRTTVQNISIYGELHRFIPVIAHNNGARIAEIVVRHHPRAHGHSKYGWERLPKGFLDLVTVMVTSRYLKRPLHFFGGIGLASFLLGAACLVYLAILWVLGDRPIGNRPLLTYGMLLVIMGVQLFSVGVLAEMLIHFWNPSTRPLIKETIGVQLADHDDKGPRP
jgi:glycosyltransferase involved in cell wall biosynthesis